MNKIDSKRKRLWTGAFVFFCLIVNLHALNVPVLEGRVNDKAGLMNSRERQQAEEYLASVEAKNGVQIAVLTVQSLEGESLESYSMKVVEKWKLGDKKADNGVLFLVAYNERAVRIEVGYGLEGTLTDAKSGMIIRNVVIPEFRNGDYGKGILKGVQTIGGIVAGDVEVEQELQDAGQMDASGALFAMIVIFIWSLIVLSCILSRYGIWRILLWNMMGRRGPRPKPRPHNPNINTVVRTFNTFSGNSGSHSSFGGGFSGGGGHFGGGGASGHW